VPSNALIGWHGARAAAMNEIAAAHLAVGGSGRGRRYATEQINHAYAMLVAAQFQGFCRELHTECAVHIAGHAGLPPAMSLLFRAELTRARQLDRGNAQPASLGADFGRLGLKLQFWDVLRAADPASVQWRDRLEILNEWRNAIAHQDFSSARLRSGTLRLEHVRRWRGTCNRLARLMDGVLHRHLLALTGVAPWT
jgi:hypothetical protein